MQTTSLVSTNFFVLINLYFNASYWFVYKNILFFLFYMCICMYMKLKYFQLLYFLLFVIPKLPNLSCTIHYISTNFMWKNHLLLFIIILFYTISQFEIVIYHVTGLIFDIYPQCTGLKKFSLQKMDWHIQKCCWNIWF